MCKGGNLNTLKLKIKQVWGKILRVWHLALHTIQFCLMKNNQFRFFFQKKVNFLADIFTMKKPYSKLFSGIKSLLLTNFQKFCVTFFKTFGMQNGGMIIFFLT